MPPEPSPELDEKDRRIREYLARHGLEAVLLATPANFAWASGGADNRGEDEDAAVVAALLVTPAAKYLLCEEGEQERILSESPGLQGAPSEVHPWGEPDGKGTIHRLVAGRVAADTPLVGVDPLGTDFAALRLSLTVDEIGRLRELGERMGVAMARACAEVRPGLSEHRIAGMLAGDLHAFGITPALLQIAVDERAARIQRPRPTEQRLERLVMLRAGGRLRGLHAVMTRAVHFGDPPPELRRSHDTVTQAEAACIATTRPGARIAEVSQAGLQLYAASGCAQTCPRRLWGGAIGYTLRDEGTAPDAATVQPNQAFAWRATLGGTASEDTFLATEAGPEILTATPDLPTVQVAGNGSTLARPDIIVR